jgi:iron complex outermembrane recepter protein
MKRTRSCSRLTPPFKATLVSRQGALWLTGAGLVIGSAGALAQSAPAAGTSELQTVVISTSVRKKLETTQEIPSTVNVLSGAELQAQGVLDVKGIEYKIPGLVLGNLGFDGALIGLRGASSTRGFTGDESTVAVHLDGIYVPQSGAALGRLFDVSRVDTLYGPQGTLYGRNAVSGVIDIVSNAPGPKFGGTAGVTLGSFSGKGLDGYVNVPLSEGSGLRVAFATFKDDGYIQNVIASSPVRSVGNDEFSAGRIRYVNSLGADTRLDVTFQASKDGSIAAFQPRYLDSVASRTPGIKWRQTAIDQPVDYDRKDSNLAIKLDTAVAGLRLRSITGYTTYKAAQKNDRELSISPSPAGLVVLSQDSKAFSQELTLSALDPGAIDWRVGLYYTKTEVTENRQGESITSVFPGQRNYEDFRLRQDGDAKAVYASLDWKPVDALTATVGIRYNDEGKAATQDHAYGDALPKGVIPNCAGAAAVLLCRSIQSADFNWTGTSGDLAFKWQFNKETMAYVRAARGFRSGAVGGYVGQDNYFDQLFGGTGTFGLVRLKPETLDSLELGVKNTLMKGQLSLNAAVYRNTYKDQLFAYSDPITFRFVDGNIGSSETNGVDLNAAFSPTGTGFRVDASIAYSDGEIKKLSTAGTGLAVGNKPILAPKLSASLGASQRFGLFGGQLALGADYNFKDKMYQDLQNTILQPSVELLNVNASWTAPSGAWRLFASVNNALDKEYLSRPANAIGGAPTPVFVGEPRKWKVGAAVNF